MPVPGNPVAPLVVGQTYTLQAPITPSTGQQWVVELDNVSPYPLTIGGSIASSVLPPMQSNTYTAHSGPAGVTVTVNAPFDNSTPPEGVPAYLTSTWAILPDTIQGVYPMAIPPTVLTVGDQATSAGPYTLAAGGSVNVPVPLWARSAAILLQGTDGILEAKGATTGATYLAFTPFSASLGISTAGTSFSVMPQIDPTITISAFPPPGPASAMFAVYFSSASPPPPFAPGAQQVISAGSNAPTTITLLPAVDTSTVYEIDQISLLASSAPGTGDFAQGVINLALLSQGPAAPVILNTIAQGGGSISQSVTPGIATYPGTTVTMTASGTGTIAVFCSVIYRRLTT